MILNCHQIESLFVFTVFMSFRVVKSSVGHISSLLHFFFPKETEEIDFDAVSIRIALKELEINKVCYILININTYS